MPRLAATSALASLCCALVLLTGCGGGGNEDDAGAVGLATSARITTATPAVSITVIDNLFSPGQRTVAVGDEVHWDWDGKNLHSVVGMFGGVQIDSGQMSGKNRFTYKFEQAGVFEYQCGVHGTVMTGKITVR